MRAMGAPGFTRKAEVHKINVTGQDLRSDPLQSAPIENITTREINALRESFKGGFYQEPSGPEGAGQISGP